MWDLTVKVDHDFYVDTIVGPILAHNCPADLSQWGVSRKTYQTYIKFNRETGQYYAGRTSGYGTPLENIDARDASHEYNDLGFGPAQLDKSSESYAAIRGREQQMIEYYRSQGISGNVYNGIWPNNPNRESYLQTALDEFGTPP